MTRYLRVWSLILGTGLISMALLAQTVQQPPGYVLERDAEIAKKGPGPHNGKGQTTGYVFFDKAPGFKLSFRKRILHAGSTIGYHQQDRDEIYYFTSGTGRMTINGQEFELQPGDCFLTRTGSSHGVVQTGKEDLVIIIAYEK
jgi:mannose-6-phosphate isomerase-like protein (cupin superfamily)